MNETQHTTDGTSNGDMLIKRLSEDKPKRIKWLKI